VIVVVAVAAVVFCPQWDSVACSRHSGVSVSIFQVVDDLSIPSVSSLLTEYRRWQLSNFARLEKHV